MSLYWSVGKIYLEVLAKLIFKRYFAKLTTLLGVFFERKTTPIKFRKYGQIFEIRHGNTAWKDPMHKKNKKIKNPPYIPENFFRSIWWILIIISILHFKYFKNHFESDRLHGTCIPKSTCSILHFSGLLWQYGLHQWFAAVILEDYQPYSTITGTCFCNNSLPYSMINRCMCPWAFLAGAGRGAESEG